jgi:hypothetical protein
MSMLERVSVHMPTCAGGLSLDPAFVAATAAARTRPSMRMVEGVSVQRAKCTARIVQEPTGVR